MTTEKPNEAESAPNERCDLPLLGMHCASCAGRIEKALSKAPGVEDASVNFATTRATVHFDPQQTSPQKLRDVVKSAGYDAIVSPDAAAGEDGSTPHHAAPADTSQAEQEARAAEYAAQKTKFIVALVLTIPVAVLAMGSHITALQGFLNFPGRAWAEMVLTTPVLFWAGREFFTGAWGAAKHRAADMNTLIAIGTLAAYLYSAVVTAAPHWLQRSERAHV